MVLPKLEILRPPPGLRDSANIRQTYVYQTWLTRVQSRGLIRVGTGKAVGPRLRSGIIDPYRTRLLESDDNSRPNN